MNSETKTTTIILRLTSLGNRRPSARCSAFRCRSELESTEELLVPPGQPAYTSVKLGHKHGLGFQNRVLVPIQQNRAHQAL